MYRLIPLSNASETRLLSSPEATPEVRPEIGPNARPAAGSHSRASLWSVLVSLAAALGLSLLGLFSLAVIGYYLPAASSKAYWFVSRSSGVIAYLLITVSVLWGLVQSGALFRPRVPPLLALGLHNYLSLAGLALAALHGLILLGDSYTRFSLQQVMTPFMSTYRPIPVGLGIVGFYLMLLLSVSFYLRRWIGQKSFRLLHYGSFGAFALVTLHGVLAGTDSGPLWPLYALSLILVLGLTALRVAGTRRKIAARA